MTITADHTDVLDTIDVPTTMLPEVPAPKTTHRFTVDTASFVDAGRPLDLQVGDEVDVALRVRIAGVSHREGYVHEDEHTVTTTAKLLALHAVDDEPTPTPEPDPVPPTIERVVVVDHSWRWFGIGGLCFGIACLAAMWLPYVS